MAAPRITAALLFLAVAACDGQAMLMPGAGHLPGSAVDGAAADTLPKPTVSFSGGTVTAAGDVELTVEVDDSIRVFTVELYDNDEPVTAMVEAPFVMPLSFDASTNGVHRVFARVTDKGGDFSDSDPVVITVAIPESGGDSTKPTVSITRPATTVSAIGPVTIEASASDDGAVKKVRFIVDGVVLADDLDATNGWSAPWYATSGLHSITAHAWDAAGNEGVSATYSVRVDQQAIAPSAPTAVSALAGNGLVTVTFTPSSGATSHNLYWSLSPLLNLATATKISQVTSPAVHSGLTNGLTYFYFVTAVGLGGESAPSPVVSATPRSTTDAIAPTFGGLMLAAGQSASSVYLSWNAASDNVTAANELVYEIYRSTSPTMSYATPIFTTQPGATSFTVSSLSGATTYYFAVRAKDAAGNRDTNQFVRSATTLAASSAAP